MSTTPLEKFIQSATDLIIARLKHDQELRELLIRELKLQPIKIESPMVLGDFKDDDIIKHVISLIDGSELTMIQFEKIVNSIKNSGCADFPFENCDTNTLNFQMKVEYLEKVIEKYSLDQIESALPC